MNQKKKRMRGKTAAAWILTAALLAGNGMHGTEYFRQIPAQASEETEEILLECESESELLTEGKTEALSEVQTESSPEDETGRETESEIKTGTETDIETETVSETETQSVSEKETQTETESEISSETERESESETETEAAGVVCTCGEESDDPFDHDPDCPYFLKALLIYCDCGCESEDLKDHNENCMCLQMLRQLEAAADEAEVFSMDQSPSGAAISSLSDWKKATSQTVFSSDYRPVKFYSGISSVEYFSSSSKVVVGKQSSGTAYLYPTADGLGGTFGILYKKVLYNQNQWYDLRMTITDYTSSVKCDNSKTAASYPYLLGMRDTMIWKFCQPMGALVARCEFLESGTGKKAAVNTRFQWWDIDSAQRFGIKTGDGQIAGRYYYEGSPLHVLKNQTVAGVPGMEVMIGQGDDTYEGDAKYCVTFELKNCSTYYMSFGERDHIDSDDYSYSKSHVEELNESFADGSMDSAERFEGLLQTDTSFSVIDTPKPEKSVSVNAGTWGTECTLASPDDTFWYQLRQNVPWQDTGVFYDSFVLQDTLPKGVAYLGELKVTREEDQKNVTDSFTCACTDGVLTVSAKSGTLQNSGFYGYHYKVQFKVKMVKNDLTPVKEGSKRIYTVTNKVKLTYHHKNGGSSQSKESGTVKTTASLIRKETPAPVKGIEQQEGIKEKKLLMADEKIEFSVFQQIPENDAAFFPVSIKIEDTLEDCLMYESASVWLKKKGEQNFREVSGWGIRQQGQAIYAEGSLPADYAGGKAELRISCSLKENYDLTAWKTGQADGGIWIRVQNKAAVSLTWPGEPTEKKETNPVEVLLRENHIRLIKEIDPGEIVWAHGNPTFTFRVEGKDRNGKEHRWVRVVEFEKANTPKEAAARLETDFPVPAGSYTASEEKTMRYHLSQISEVRNGSQNGETVQFDLSEGADGSAVFHNEKITDGQESHTSFVRNVIGTAYNN